MLARVWHEDCREPPAAPAWDGPLEHDDSSEEAAAIGCVTMPVEAERRRGVLGGLLGDGAGRLGSSGKSTNVVNQVAARMVEWRTPEPRTPDRSRAQQQQQQQAAEAADGGAAAADGGCNNLPLAPSPSAAAILRSLLRSGEERLLGGSSDRFAEPLPLGGPDDDLISSKHAHASPAAAAAACESGAPI